ncbi:molybdopterin biosynthesis protein [Belnapia sp. T6]|uniref:Molybdopterin molybdenumtransferase n=1 Tax=Belnapia mucosa TaxID=2804532 RepID=A0ABS1V9J2_9PROT|nr:molybdopterin biosynthesis protein [Belnapia mucosa]MBL6458313.1 molybdopterin biosynthesis protein [Belnapia mucosa]
MSAPPRLAPLEEARALLPTAPVAPRRLPLDRAIDHVLAAPLRAPGPLPPAPVALREGWAVASALTEGAGPYAPLPLPGLAWVVPGEALPPGTDAVLPPFALEDGAVLEPVAPGEGVRLAGELAAAGAELRPAGHLLAPADLLLAAAGIAAVEVRVPRIALRGAGLLAALVRAEGAEVVEAAPDLVLAVGATPDPLLLPAIATRPGEGLAVGRLDGAPALLLPAEPEAMLAGWWLLARPALRALAGRAPPPRQRMRLARKIASPIGFTELVALGADGAPAPPLGLVAALLTVPAGREGYEAGTEVEVEAP